MLNEILNLNGTRKIAKSELKSVQGGKACSVNDPCPPGTYCEYLNSNEGRCVVI